MARPAESEGAPARAQTARAERHKADAPNDTRRACGKRHKAAAPPQAGRKKAEEVAMIYFDNAATGGRKPDAVVRAVRASIEGPCGNPGRSGHALSVALAENVLRCR